MSGILAVWNSQQQTPWQKMLDDLAVLGQDGRGDWHDVQVSLSLGRSQFYNTPQSCLEPPVVEAEGCVLVWDGRLDDREALLAGRSANITDAQLIIESYRHWGADCLRHLIGEFVMILWDAVNDLLFVGCDSVGGRTIAYAWDGQTLLLSSRLLSLLLHPQVSPQLNELYVAHTLCDLWSQFPGMTPFLDIKRLRPGHVLILKSGQLHQQQVASLAIPERYPSRQHPEDYYEKFWYLLDQAVKDRLRSHRPVCTTLSGGLDSTTVTVSLLNHLPTVAAFSNTTEIYPEFDERQPIASFLQRYPQINWHEVNSDNAWVLSEPWDRLPATDDPFSINTLAMNLQLMARMQQLGFGLMFSGDFGDELFRTTIPDQVKANDWRQILQVIKTEERWHSTLWWELAVPHLPQPLQRPWLDKHIRVVNPLPAWLAANYAQKPKVQTALQQFAQTTLFYGQAKGIIVPMEQGSFVGATQASRLISAAYQMEETCPLQDQRLVEFALSLPPSLQYDPVHDKIFLRQANRSILPEDVRCRPKDNYFDSLKYAGIGKGCQAIPLLEQAKHSSYLKDKINFDLIKNCLLDYRQKYAEAYSPGQPFYNNTASQLCAFFAFSIWHEKVKEYCS